MSGVKQSTSSSSSSSYDRTADAGRHTSKKEFHGYFSRVLASLEGVKDLRRWSKSRETINKMKPIFLHSDFAAEKNGPLSADPRWLDGRFWLYSGKKFWPLQSNPTSPVWNSVQHVHADCLSFCFSHLQSFHGLKTKYQGGLISQNDGCQFSPVIEWFSLWRACHMCWKNNSACEQFSSWFWCNTTG